MEPLLEWRENLAYIKYSEAPLRVDFQYMIGKVIGDSRFDEIEGVILDFHSVITLNLSRVDKDILRNLLEVPTSFKRKLKVAYVIEKSNIQNEVKDHIDEYQKLWSWSIFPSIEEATKWILSQ